MNLLFKNTLRAVACLSILTVAFAQEVPASVKAAITEADAAIAKIVAVPDAQRTWDNTLGAFDDAMARLERATSLPIFMANVATDAKARADVKTDEEIRAHSPYASALRFTQSRTMRPLCP